MPTTLDLQDKTVDTIIASDISGTNSEIELPPTTVNEKALLIENMVLTEPDEPIKKLLVPNHLLDTKIYANLGQNAYVQTKPSEILFEGFETDNFSIKYKKPERMVAGMVLKCTVEFNPDEWRYYYDCIRVFIVRISQKLHISSNSCREQQFTKSFLLKSVAPIDFEFSFKYIQRHPAFQIDPESGIVPANSETEITVTFAPFEFQTAVMKVELVVSQFNFKGLISTFTGTSQPGLQSPKYEAVEKIKPAATRKVTSAPSQIPLEKNGIQFPQLIESPHAVAKVLLQKPGKLKVNEMRQNLQQQKEGSAMTRQMKEVLFDQLVRQNVYEERQNQLRWQVKLGDRPMTIAEKFQILEERSVAESYYRHKVQGIPLEDEEFLRPTLSLWYRRTFEVADKIATFDSYSNDLWGCQTCHALDRFVQAARKVIIRNRCDKRLRDLKKLKKSISGVVQVEGDSKIHLEEDNADTLTGSLKLNKIKIYISNLYALGVVSVPPTEIVVKRDVPFFNLKVPLYYQLYGYKPHNVHEAASGYVPVRNLRRLRTGAEDEEIRLSADQSDPCQVITEASCETKVARFEENVSESKAPAPFPKTLKPPESL
ncbi:hypothetical protein Btru_010045 [Bulinus truncatus]|nr:hypothetical protein Btru_010045 [Bulinus truncatus]